MQNGIFDLDKRELEPHNPDEIFLRQIPVAYDPEAKCPEVSNFLSSVVGSEEDLKVLIEWVGYCMIPDTRQQKALMLQGTGSNGKSVFLNFVNEFMQISHKSVQYIE